MKRHNKLMIAASLSAAAAHSLAAKAPLADMESFHQSLLTIDTHVDIPSNYATLLVDPAKKQLHQVDLVKMQQGGLDAAFFIVFVAQQPRNNWNYEQTKAKARHLFKAIHRMVDNNSDKIALARTAKDVRDIHKAGKKVALIGIENGYAIGKDLSLLEDYFKLGARYMTLTHYGHNDLGDSSNPSRQLQDQANEHGGLSNLGKAAISEMNRLGMMVDVSHTAKSTMMQAVALSRAPVIASHSGVKSVNPHARNLDDEQLRAIRRNGGVAQIVAVDEFLLNQPDEMWTTIGKIRREVGMEGYKDIPFLPAELYLQYHQRIEQEVRSKWPAVNIQDYVDHIDHAVKIAGIEHIGIASDFGGGGGVKGWNAADESQNVTTELLRRGYSKRDIAKLWGENTLRVMEEAEKVAAQTQHLLLTR
ncbi:dipeptidase [Bowmanella pacifica]|uniref:Peptidase M19 n=1 Tax=Bowmanella pacifica TaxID=502051 RepID=A0A917YVC8_9ALTE|nr:dipeptidase [Bowmanella pacifica]GGO65305.1 peptidase M19 [Bowmanella pacifica]